jgi:hypothetical protein
MAIEQTTPQDAINAYLQQVADVITQEMDNALMKLGEECVARIRDRGPESWIDQTGNLRSSIGYAVYDHAEEVVTSAFPAVLNGSDGSRIGADFVRSLAQKYANTYALVVVAGMSYAEYVEAMKNKDVLASTKLWAEQQISSKLQMAMAKAEKKLNAIKL